MKTGHQKGLDAERVAALYMWLKGYRILNKRYKTPLGEIDLVLKKGKLIVFAEVKQRGTMDIAAESLHAINQERVRKAASLYLQKHAKFTYHDVRFDAILLAPGRWPRHLKNAF